MKNRLLAVLATALTALVLTTPASLRAQAAPAAQDKPPSQDKPAADQDKRINGKWHFVFDTSGGERDANAEFTVDAEGNVTGTWEKVPATGTYKDGHLVMNFDVTAEDLNETATLHLDGQMDDSNTITGTSTFSSYDATFKATHPKP